MFFPRGKALHENLATSYVLVDALVEDLCEGGFSGIVEVVLHDADGRVLIERGKVAASLLKNNQKHITTIGVGELAARARAERGRVSVYTYSTDVASALARRADCEPLYTQLSTDFADLGKMLSKLAREREREWLIEVAASSGIEALIYIREDDCLVVTPEGDTDVADRASPTNSRALEGLLAESARAGATFDVYFRRATPDHVEEVEENQTTPPTAPAEPAEVEPAEIAAPEAAEVEEPEEVEELKISQAVTSQGSPFATNHDDANEEFDFVEPARVETQDEIIAGDVDYSEEMEMSEPPMAPDMAVPDAARQGLTAHLFASAAVAESAGEAEMIEVKRLMGEIARTLEDAIRAVSQHSNFAMHLRAGQLRVADRYPFLDPFGNEFEYLAGEIAFVGKVKPGDFINGLTEALRIALASAIQSTGQPARLRAIAAEDLRLLGQHHRSGFEEFGLDQAVERILEA
ncbi:MAG TPA: hypothetical protein VF131_03635 [Blastocatellia bacterium]|nr:hypothetical protein [Blastocatellia bacterium]